MSSERGTGYELFLDAVVVFLGVSLRVVLRSTRGGMDFELSNTPSHRLFSSRRPSRDRTRARVFVLDDERLLR